MAHLEVDGIHPQLVGVQVAQLGQGAGQIVDVFNSLRQRLGYFLAMSLDLGGAVAQVEVGEVCLGGGERVESPVGSKGSIIPSTGHWGARPMAEDR